MTVSRTVSSSFALQFRGAGWRLMTASARLLAPRPRTRRTASHWWILASRVWLDPKAVQHLKCRRIDAIRGDSIALAQISPADSRTACPGRGRGVAGNRSDAPCRPVGWRPRSGTRTAASRLRRYAPRFALRRAAPSAARFERGPFLPAYSTWWIDYGGTSRPTAAGRGEDAAGARSNGRSSAPAAPSVSSASPRATAAGA